MLKEMLNYNPLLLMMLVQILVPIPVPIPVLNTPIRYKHHMDQ